MHIADLLSRSYLEETDEDQSYLHEVIHCIGLASYLECTNEQKQELVKEIINDAELNVLTTYIQTGWPDNIRTVPDNLKFYFKLRQDITLDQQLIFMNHRLIVPKSLRITFLSKLHEGHLGITKMKQTARNLYYWPLIDNHIEEFVRRCFVCQTYKNNNVKEPLLSHEVPTLPFSKIGVDIMDFKRKSYLVIYDYMSKWLEIKHLTSKSATAIINTLKELFSCFGIPLEVVSDHVPFDSLQCKKFAQEWGFKFSYSSPRYPQSNGMAERGVQIAKKMLIKCYEDKTDLSIALLQYRASPVSGTQFSPSQLMMNRNIKTKLPTNHQHLIPKLNNNVQSQFQKCKNRNERNYNRTARIKNNFESGQDIWFKKDPLINKWIQGKIISNNNFRSYDVTDNNGSTYTRTSYHIRPQ